MQQALGWSSCAQSHTLVARCLIGHSRVPCCIASLTQVGVRMPSATPQLNSIPETQRITVSGLQRARTTTLKYVYPTTATATTFTEVTIGTDTPEKLLSDRVSVRLVVNGAAVTVPITATATEMDDAIEAALGGRFATNDVLFGVRKVRGRAAA